MIQRETGGNLAEILTSIAHLIRERFRLHGHVRTLAAEGKFSAYILAAIPFFVSFILLLMSPGYVETLFDRPNRQGHDRDWCHHDGTRSCHNEEDHHDQGVGEPMEGTPLLIFVLVFIVIMLFASGIYFYLRHLQRAP